MARRDDWQREVRDGTRREPWVLHGPGRIVKVLPLGGSNVRSLGGYITQGKFLVGKTPHEMESSLGLKAGYLRTGARVFAFSRLPRSDEFDYELTAAYPGGLAFNVAHGSADYLPGSAQIHQWRIRDGVAIPVDPGRCLVLQPTERFPYAWLTNG